MFYYSYHFGQGSGPVLFAGLNCIGNEHKLEDCPSSLYPYHYSHSGDVGVKCLEKGLYYFNIELLKLLQLWLTVLMAVED